MRRASHCWERLFRRPAQILLRPAPRCWRLELEILESRICFSGDTLATAMPLSFAASPVAQVSDTLTTANQVDLYAVTLHQGDQLTAAINAQQQGSPLQAALRLFDSSGTELRATASSKGHLADFAVGVLEPEVPPRLRAVGSRRWRMACSRTVTSIVWACAGANGLRPQQPVGPSPRSIIPWPVFPH